MHRVRIENTFFWNCLLCNYYFSIPLPPFTFLLLFHLGANHTPLNLRIICFRYNNLAARLLIPRHLSYLDRYLPKTSDSNSIIPSMLFNFFRRE